MREDVGITRGGPKSPLAVTPARAARSVRRTTTIDSARPDGPAGDVRVTARGRDLLTPVSGGTALLGFVELAARISADRVLRALEHPDARLASLVGVPVASGFRGRVLELVPDEAERLTLLNLLLDDLPGASLVAGFALQRDPGWNSGPIPAAHLSAATDLCAGWASDATILQEVRAVGRVPVPTTAPVPCEDGDDPEAWHERPVLPAGAMRRARLLDVVADDPGGGTVRFDVHFRDSYRDAADGEGAVHEYAARGRFAPATRTIVELDVAARVLPWVECPQALGSARRVIGATTDALRTQIRRAFVGTGTCTHLNDVLRSLADLPALAAPLCGDVTEA